MAHNIQINHPLPVQFFTLQPTYPSTATVSWPLTFSQTALPTYTSGVNKIRCDWTCTLKCTDLRHSTYLFKKSTSTHFLYIITVHPQPKDLYLYTGTDWIKLNCPSEGSVVKGQLNRQTYTCLKQRQYITQRSLWLAETGCPETSILFMLPPNKQNNAPNKQTTNQPPQEKMKMKSWFNHTGSPKDEEEGKIFAVCHKHMVVVVWNWSNCHHLQLSVFKCLCNILVSKVWFSFWMLHAAELPTLVLWVVEWNSTIFQPGHCRSHGVLRPPWDATLLERCGKMDSVHAEGTAAQSRPYGTAGGEREEAGLKRSKTIPKMHQKLICFTIYFWEKSKW